IVDTLKFEAGNMAMVTGGHNVGRVGVIVHRERHLGGFDIIHLRDAKNNEFATRISNVFVIGKGEKAWISLPKEKGIRLSIMENRQVLLKKQQMNN
ncbi:ribosomal protein RPS4, partial [Toxoplasma gondii RUB]